ncbi:hypothetical protein BFW01_g4326 [Lasiodiplodia theobromae]|uniref:Proteoglycan 4 n=1 Tax=Lasiodiplodia theobromae TaxID=45133 RepID=A0A5N5D1V6_9PEZI|nr:uncharacterized protein LTHEOB_10913 [Lasiodiplodia theobromae]KAB2571344.1 Proteoglycan 4 [Lasiodiplodia theobromae]KAF4538346.1 hypothetical protein LTHEOB_10913 [Lasiodiplodia theobromae]KAF9633432.1 hypothetical protein BFW01_g4326 [Lasiodiplodia theobromae]
MSSSSPPPKRRFVPEPVETTTKSSRRFAPEPVETTTKSSRRFAPEPVETTTKSSRRFAPEPVETTIKSSRRFAPEPIETTARSSRKFAPEPVETSSRSSKDRPPPADDAAPRRRFAPQPVETTTRTNRAGAENGVNGADVRSSDTSFSDAQASPQIDGPPQSVTKPRRKFAPQLIETAKRTRKSGDVGPTVNEADRTEATPDTGTRSPARRPRPPPTPLAPSNTPNGTLPQVPSLREARRLGIPTRSDSIGSNRSHSFRVPDLDTIESSESEEERTPSLSTSPSAESDSEQSYLYYHATRRRESVDERFSGYLLEIAAKAAEKQMREAAMAAFPNDDHHEPVAHFLGDEEDDVVGETMEDVNEERRESFTKVNWELLAMQKHMEEREEGQSKDNGEKVKRADEPTKKNIWGEPQWGAKSTKNALADSATKSPWTNPFANQRGRQDEQEMKGMQRGARPPMLGSDIVFPRCPSPEPAKFDVTQGSEALRNSMCYLTEQSQPSEPQGLWWHEQKKEEPRKQATKPTGLSAKEGRSKPPTLWSNPGSRPPSPAGLWNGCCRGPGSRESTKQAGMLTPRIEVDNPFDSPPPTPARAPPSPPPSNPDIASIDDKLAAQKALEEEFNDAFVTQVYNYLSLGYPSLARKFDDELSKISRIPVEELRQDDELAQARGYIRLGEDNNARDAGITEDTCMRWRALRTYIFEWAKQQPRFLHAGYALGGFGVAARRGSWAW